MIHDNAEFHNIEEFLPLPDGAFEMTRYPEALRRTLTPNGIAFSLHPTGAEVRFNVRSGEPVLRLRCDAPNSSDAEIFWGSFNHSKQPVTEHWTEIKITPPSNMPMLERISKLQHLPFAPHLARVILPYGPTIHYGGIVGDIEPPRREQLPDRTMLMYGSSITMGGCAHRAVNTFASRAARLLCMDLLNLGLGGSAMCEPGVANYIAARADWDLAVLELGVNMCGEFSMQEFQNRVEYFIPTIAKAHPASYVFCLDIFPFYGDLDSADNKHHEFRRIVRQTVQKLDLFNVIYLDATTMLRDLSGLTTDLIHPSPAGMEEIARNLVRQMSERMKW